MKASMTEAIEDRSNCGMLDFLAHGGQMGALISAQDWGGSPLGPPAGWPSALKIMLSTLLGNSQPMLMGWGPDLLSFFNDSYRPLLGMHFDGTLGRPAAQQWPDSWGELGPTVIKALGGVASHYDNIPLSLTRSGAAETTWWTLSLVPFRDEAGAVVGVYGFPVETTEKVVAEQRRAQAQKLQAFRADLGDALRDAADSKDLMSTAAEKLGQYLKADCVGYGEVDDSGESLQVHQVWTAGSFQGVLGTHRLEDFGPLLIEQLRAGRTIAVNDTANDPLISQKIYQSAYAALGKQAFIDAPLIKNGRLAVVLFMLSTRIRLWTDSDIALVNEVAERTWASLQRLQAELALRKINRVLDQRNNDLMHSEDALRQAQKLDALGQLTAGVAHDFNNYLGIINFCVHLLRSDKLPPHERPVYMDQIANTAERAAKVTAQLLAFGRREPSRVQVFEVSQQVANMVDLVRPLMGSELQIHFKHSARNAFLAAADITQFGTALINLTVNARDAMNGKGILSLKVQRTDHVPARLGIPLISGAFIAVSVADTGDGIPAGKLKEIFEPFYTTKSVGKGTGLGLSQVVGFVRNAGGQVDVRSELGQGSVFTLYLPCADV